MSATIAKGVKRTPSRLASRQSSTASAAKKRQLASGSTRPKPMVKKSASTKPPARKATKATKLAKLKSSPAKPKSVKKQVKKAVATRKPAAKKSKPVVRPAKAKAAPKKLKALSRKIAKPAPRSKPTRKRVLVAKPIKAVVRRPSAPPPPPPRQPTLDEAAALRAFERAHKEFVRGNFGEARSLFSLLLERHSAVSEVAARARMYLKVVESRSQAESSLPRDADSLYDRGVMEFNRGDFVAAQELFERALKREPDAAHVHYELATTRARLGSIESALDSLRRALGIQPSLRLRAQHDLDLVVLRNEPEFDRLVFQHAN